MTQVSGCRPQTVSECVVAGDGSVDHDAQAEWNGRDIRDCAPQEYAGDSCAYPECY